MTAGNSSAATYGIAENGTLALVTGPVPDGQGAACWIRPARGFYFVANTATDDISSYRIDEDGAVVLVKPIAADGVNGAIDEAASGRYLYVQAGTDSVVDEFVVHSNGTLTLIGHVATGLNQEGLVAA